MEIWDADGITRRFPILWALLTASYALAVGYRSFTSHTTPGLPTWAGFSAVATVWLDFYPFFHSRALARFLVVLALFTTIAINMGIIAGTMLQGRAFPVGRLVFTLVFALILYDKTR